MVVIEFLYTFAPDYKTHQMAKFQIKDIFYPKFFSVLKKGYTKKQFTKDLFSGIIVGIVALPLAIAFAVASGVSPDTLSSLYGCAKPAVGEYVNTTLSNRPVRLWRMPSSSRAYPIALEKKAEAYASMFKTAGLLPC